MQCVWTGGTQLCSCVCSFSRGTSGLHLLDHTTWPLSPLYVWVLVSTPVDMGTGTPVYGPEHGHTSWGPAAQTAGQETLGKAELPLRAAEMA